MPGDLEESLLIEAIRYTNKDLAMPPEKAGGKLPDEVIKDFETWVQMGAPDPRDGRGESGEEGGHLDGGEGLVVVAAAEESARAGGEGRGVAEERHRPLSPRRAGGERTEAGGRCGQAHAAAARLLRPHGLAADAAGDRRFLNDSSPDAFEKVVDRLLASPQFGERWGRHWLDVARYAESTGKDVNLAFPNAWRYRDYVIAAFNEDKPYDQFLREQIAGDLLPAKDDKQRAEQLIATGFLAIGTKSVNEANARQFALDLADEQIDTVSQALLGVTVACARCHDHKFDPIPQSDYYALAGIFLSTDTRYGTFFAAQNRSATELIELPQAGGRARVAACAVAAGARSKSRPNSTSCSRKRNELADATFKPAAGGNRNPRGQLLLLLRMNQIGLLEAELGSFGSDGKMRPLAMGVLDQPAHREESRTRGRETPRYENSTPDQAIASRYLERDGRFARPPEFRVVNESPVFARGDVNKPGEKVPRGFLVGAHARSRRRNCPPRAADGANWPNGCWPRATRSPRA